MTIPVHGKSNLLPNSPVAGVSIVRLAGQAYTSCPAMASPSASRPWLKMTVPFLTLGFPLVVVLVVILRLPVEELSVSCTDTRLLRGVSTFWCGWQEVTSSHPFYAYKVPDEPDIAKDERRPHEFSFRFTLQRGHFHLLRYHLLAGSSIDASGCATQAPVVLNLASGDNFESCFDKKPDEDDSSSESDDDIDVIQLNSRCQISSTFLKHVGYPSDEEDHVPNCRADFDPRLTLNVTRTGLYYVIVRSLHAQHSLNRLLVHVRLNRTSYRLPDNMILCRSQSSCEIPLTFGSNERVVVFIPAEPDAGSVAFPVRSQCKPRIVFYLIVFLLLPVTFAVALAFAIKTRRVTNRGHPSANRLHSVPLLDDHNVTSGLPKPAMDAPPPSYSTVAQLPPSYQVALAAETAQLAPPTALSDAH